MDSARYNEAIPLIQQLEQQAVNQRDSFQLFQANIYRAEILYHQSYTDSALEFIELHSFANKLPLLPEDRQGQALCLYLKLLLSKKDNQKADQLLDKLPKTGVNFPPSYLLASRAYAKANRTAAISFARTATQQSQDPFLKGEFTLLMAKTFHANRKYDSASHYYHQSWKYLKKIKGQNHPGINASRYGLARIHRSLQDNASAIPLLESYIMASKESFGEQLPPATARAYGQLALCHNYRGDPFKGIFYYQKALTINQQHYQKDHSRIGFTYQGLGLVSNHAGKYLQALDYYHKSLKILKDTYGQNHIYTANIFNNLGSTYEYLGEPDKAFEYYSRSYQIREKLQKGKSLAGAKNLNNIGVNLLKANDYAQSLSYFEHALSVLSSLRQESRREKAQYLNNCAIAYLRLGNKEKASLTLNQAASTLIPNYQLSSGQIPKVDEILFPEVFLNIQNVWLDLSTSEAKDLRSLKKGLRHTADLLSFLDKLRSSSSIPETQLGYQGVSHEIMEKYLSLAWKIHQLAQEPSVIEQALSRIVSSNNLQLLSSLNGKNAWRSGWISEELYARERALSDSINALNQQIISRRFTGGAENQLAKDEAIKGELLARQESLIKVIESAYPDYYSLKFSTPKIEISGIKNSINKGEKWIQYFLGDSILSCFTLSREQISWRQYSFKEAQMDSLQAFIALFTNKHFFIKGGEKNFRHFSREAYKWGAYLLNNKDIQETSSLRIIPDGVLSYLPFDALLTDRAHKSASYQTLPYAIHRFSIRYDFSLLKFQSNKKLEKLFSPVNAFVGFAPSYDQPAPMVIAASSARRSDEFGSFAPLLFNKDEVLEIQKLWGGLALSGNKADEAHFKSYAPNARLLHLACHTNFNEHHPLLSGLVFSSPVQGIQNEGTEDNILYAHEILAMDLRNELTVLSACQTGAGEYFKGEGVQSLARAFRIAGSKNVLMSLWKADDVGTYALMSSFYEALAQKEGKDQALRLAKIDLFSNDPVMSTPYYWACFAMYGDHDAIAHPVKHTIVWAVLLLGSSLLGFGLFRRYKNKKSRS